MCHSSTTTIMIFYQLTEYYKWTGRLIDVIRSAFLLIDNVQCVINTMDVWCSCWNCCRWRIDAELLWMSGFIPCWMCQVFCVQCHHMAMPKLLCWSEATLWWNCLGQIQRISVSWCGYCNALGHVCLCVSPVCALTFESLDLESFGMHVHLQNISAKFVYQGYPGAKTVYVSITNTHARGGPPLIERHSCFITRFTYSSQLWYVNYNNQQLWCLDCQVC